MLPIPNITNLDVAFGNIDHMPKYSTLPEEFQRRRGTPYNKAISSWFFNGAKFVPNGIEVDGKVFTAKPGVDANKALAAIRAILASWEPKHEHKEAGAAYLLAEWFDIEGEKQS